jgi:hypothetical protein
MTKGIRLDLTRTNEIFQSAAGRSRPPVVKSAAQLPAPFVPVVLDGKRVDANEIASRDAQPLHYTLATLKSGESALVGFSDRSVIDKLFLGHFQGAATDNPVDYALRSAGLERGTTLSARQSLDGLWMFEDVDFLGDVKYVPQFWAHNNLHEYDDGREWLDENWGDVISSVTTRNAPARLWEHIDWGGSSLYIGAFEDRANLHVIGWGDRVSSIMVGPRPGI